MKLEESQPQAFLDEVLDEHRQTYRAVSNRRAHDDCAGTAEVSQIGACTQCGVRCELNSERRGRVLVTS